MKISFSVKDRLGWIHDEGEKLYFLRRIGNITEYVIKTIQNARDVTVFDASLQNIKRGIQYFSHFLRTYETPNYT